MIQLGLTGYPLGHSLSPELHAAALKACDLDGDYSLFPVYPDDLGALEKLLGRVRGGELTGLNVTIPHKQNVIQFMDDLTPAARSIGAVNTIYLRDGQLIGDNTDAPGFLADLHRFLATTPSSIVHRLLPAHRPPPAHRPSSIVLGAGGSARAVIFALLNSGWEVTIAARRIEQARQLAAACTDHQLPMTDFMFSGVKISAMDLIINTTPLGMSPNVDVSPWPAGLPFPKSAAVYDLVYNPRETLLVKLAHSAGLCATTGLGMLVEQAALAFKLWTGRDASRDLMFDAISRTGY